MANPQKPKAGPPAAKVSDVVQNFAPSRRFGTSSSQKPFSVTSLDFDDTGELCLVAQDDDILQIYNCKEGKHAKELKSQKYGVDLARFTHHPQSIIYASTKGDDAIRYLSSHDNSYLRYFRGHTGPVTSINLSPADDTFISTSLDNTLRLWDLRSTNAQAVLNLNSPHQALFDPTATVLAVSCPPAQTILLYDARNYDKAPFATFDLAAIEDTMRQAARDVLGPDAATGHSGDWTSLSFSNDGNKLLVGTNTSGLYVLDAFEGELMAYLHRPAGRTNRASPSELEGLRQSGASTANGKRAAGQGDACFSPDGRYVLSGTGADGSVYVWDLEGLERGEPGKSKIRQPTADLASIIEGKTKAGIGQASVIGYNPRHNLLVTADKAVVFWLPEMD